MLELKIFPISVAGINLKSVDFFINSIFYFFFRMFVCPTCHFQFSHKSAYYRHLSTFPDHKPVQPVSYFRVLPTLSTNSKGKENDFECLFCGRRFGRKQHCQIHLRDVHKVDVPSRKRLLNEENNIPAKRLALQTLSNGQPWIFFLCVGNWCVYYAIVTYRDLKLEMMMIDEQ